MGRPFYPPYVLSDGNPRVWVLDVSSGLERLATAYEVGDYERLKNPDADLEGPTDARHIAWTADKSGFAWLQPDDPKKQGRLPPLTLYASNIADGIDPIRCPTDECVGAFDTSRVLRGGIHWNSAQEEVFFVRKEGVGYRNRSLYSWIVGEKHVRKILSTDEWISDCSVVNDQAVCFRETPTSPRTIISIDLGDGSIKTLFDPNPEFRSLILGNVQLLEWENSEGYGTFGYLVKPPDYVEGQRYPLVIVGYRARRVLRGGVGDEYPVHVLAANGFLVLVYEKLTPVEAYETYNDSMDIGKARWAPPELFDPRMPVLSFEAIIQRLADLGLVDPDRVAVTGFSNGVGHVNYSLIHTGLFAAAITSSSDFGPNNRLLIGGAGNAFRQYIKAIGMGPYPGPYAFNFPNLSLKLNAERVNTPLLVNVSDSEHVWALEEIVALIEHGKPVEMIVYPDEGHVKWHPAHRLSVYERNVDWLKFWLQGRTDGDPAKVEQYERWRSLCEQHVSNFLAAEDSTLRRRGKSQACLATM